MLAALLVILALAGSAFSRGPNKCDSEIISKIKACWNGHVPTDLIRTAIANGKEIVVGTTHGYYPDTIKSVFSYFVKVRGSPYTRVDIYGVTTDGVLQERYMHLEEETGTTFDPSNKVRRYHLYQDDMGGVTAFYACSEADDAVSGDPSALLKVRDFNYDKTSRSNAEATLERLGLGIKKTYF